MSKITLSEEALANALVLERENQDYQGKDLRVYLDGKGCDGFFYGVAFDVRSQDDLVFPHEGIDVIVDPESLKFIDGSTVEWVDDERGRGFLVENPGHRKFRGKFYKRENWEKRLLGQPSS